MGVEMGVKDCMRDDMVAQDAEIRLIPALRPTTAARAIAEEYEIKRASEGIKTG